MTRKTLLLNSSYEPLTVISWKRAIVLCYFPVDDLPAARIEKEYEKFVRSPTSTLKIPAVAVLRKQIKVRPRSVSLSNENVFIRDGFCCQYCGMVFPKEQLTIDHVIPRSKGGRNNWQNLVAACLPCNNAKGDKTLDELEFCLRRLPFTPPWPNIPNTPSEWEEYLF